MNNNMNINGTGTIWEGEYNNISISGVGKLSGNVAANKINISGTCSGEGSIKSNVITVNGHFKYEGGVKSKEKFSINGHSKVCNDIQGEKIYVAGNLTALKNIVFEELSIAGRLNCYGNCEGTNFECSGEVKIRGLLSGDSIYIDVYRGSSIKEIGGENIKVKADKGRGILNFINKLFNDKLLVENIEGDNIYLENTVAKIVSGNNITIGKGCKIDEVNYSGELEIKDGGIVYKKNNVGRINLLKE